MEHVYVQYVYDKEHKYVQYTYDKVHVHVQYVSDIVHLYLHTADNKSENIYVIIRVVLERLNGENFTRHN